MDNTSDFFTSFKRTIVPLIVGALITFALRYGFDFDAASATEVVGVLVTGLYYGFFRWLEGKGVTWAGFFLGSRKTPEYVTPPGVAA